MQEELLTDQLPLAETAEPTVESELGLEQDPLTEGEQSVDLSEIDKLIDKRTGFFKLKLDLADLKWVKNQVASGKIPYKGPNEAFMVMNAYMGFAAAIVRKEIEAKNQMESDGTVEMSAAAVEGAAILLNKYEGSGIESAQKVFRIAVALNDAIMEMKQLDQAIAIARQAESVTTTGEEAQPTQEN